MPRISEERRTERREQIVSAAIRCVAREGFHKATMSQVIAESGLSAGAVYGYFKGKDELIAAIAQQAVGTFAHGLDAYAASVERVDLVEALAMILGEIDQVVAESDGDLPRVAIHAWSEALRDDTVLEIVRTNIDRVYRGWRSLISRAGAEGALPGMDDAQEEALARALLGLIPGYLFEGHVLGLVESPQYAAGVRLLAGLGPARGRC